LGDLAIPELVSEGNTIVLIVTKLLQLQQGITSSEVNARIAVPILEFALSLLNQSDVTCHVLASQVWKLYLSESLPPPIREPVRGVLFRRFS
jgi:hypothetical protein